jgi:hypothetical protein
MIYFKQSQNIRNTGKGNFISFMTLREQSKRQSIDTLVCQKIEFSLSSLIGEGEPIPLYDPCS